MTSDLYVHIEITDHDHGFSKGNGISQMTRNAQGAPFEVESSWSDS